MIFMNGFFGGWFLQLVRARSAARCLCHRSISYRQPLLLRFIAHTRAYRGPRPYNRARRESGPVETGPTVPVATALLVSLFSSLSLLNYHSTYLLPCLMPAGSLPPLSDANQSPATCPRPWNQLPHHTCTHIFTYLHVLHFRFLLITSSHLLLLGLPGGRE